MKDNKWAPSAAQVRRAYEIRALRTATLLTGFHKNSWRNLPAGTTLHTYDKTVGVVPSLLVIDCPVCGWKNLEEQGVQSTHHPRLPNRYAPHVG